MKTEIIVASKYNGVNFSKELSSLIYESFRKKFSSKFFSKETAKKLHTLSVSIFAHVNVIDSLVAIAKNQLIGCLYFLNTETSDYYFRYLLKKFLIILIN